MVIQCNYMCVGANFPIESNNAVDLRPRNVAELAD